MGMEKHPGKRASPAATLETATPGVGAARSATRLLGRGAFFVFGVSRLHSALGIRERRDDA